MADKTTDIHYQIFTRVKSRAESLEGSTSGLLKKYRQNQKKYSNRSFMSATEEELIESVKNAQITYMGDFHTFDQNQRNLIRIIKTLVKTKSTIIVGLEMVDYIYNDKINAYLNDHITELEFLESINYHDSWRFPWNHYKVIFEMAGKYNYQIIGLNTQGDLDTRDHFAATLLAQYLKANQDYSLIVLFGEYHIAPNKMPKFTFDLVGDPNLKQTIIHQNLDEVYFKLRTEERNDAIVKYNPSEFCLMSSPPWVKYESQIYWFENLDHDPDFDLHEYLIEHGNKIFSDSAQENFPELMLGITQTLDLDLNPEIFDDFNLKDHTALDYVENYIISEYPKKLQRLYQRLLIENYSFHLSGSNLYYCSNYSLNRLSYLSGDFIYHYFLRENGFSEKEILKKGSNKEIFIYFILGKMVSYFVSKIVNPHRKCNMYGDFTSSNDKVDQKVVMIMDNSHQYEQYLKGLNVKTLFDISERLGHIYGEYLFNQSFVNKKFHSDLIGEIIKNINLDPSNFSNLTLKLLVGTNYKTDKKRLF